MYRKTSYHYRSDEEGPLIEYLKREGYLLPKLEDFHLRDNIIKDSEGKMAGVRVIDGNPPIGATIHNPSNELMLSLDSFIEKSVLSGQKVHARMG